MATDSLCVHFSGLTVRFRFPNPISPPEGLCALQCPDPGLVDEEYEVQLLSSPLTPAGKPLACVRGIDIYATDAGILRVFSPLTAPDHCQVACLLGHNGKNVLYYPASTWPHYAADLHFYHLLSGEAMLARHDAFLLHSSIVVCDGKAVLFCGPSGIGKSTQASLWQQHLNADLLNGDRTVIRWQDGVFYGGGSLWCGTSRVYRSEQAPVAGVFLLEQAPDNHLQRLGAESFSPLFQQIIVNSWDPEFMAHLTQLLANFINTVPIYRLRCRPDIQAVKLCRNVLSKKEASPCPINPAP